MKRVPCAAAENKGESVSAEVAARLPVKRKNNRASNPRQCRESLPITNGKCVTAFALKARESPGAARCRAQGQRLRVARTALRAPASRLRPSASYSPRPRLVVYLKFFSTLKQPLSSLYSRERLRDSATGQIATRNRAPALAGTQRDTALSHVRPSGHGRTPGAHQPPQSCLDTTESLKSNNCWELDF